MNSFSGQIMPCLRQLPFFTCVLCWTISVLAYAKDDAGMAGRDARPAVGSAGAGTRAAADGTITLHNGLLTIAVRSRPLTAVLDEISRAARVAIMLDDTRADVPVISLRAQDVPPDQALLRILKGYDVFFFYAPEENGAAGLKAVWAYPKGRGQGLVPVPPTLWASTKDIERQLEDPNAEVRAKAIGTLISRKGPDALDAVITALKDDHSHVRTQALYGAVAAGVPVPVGTLNTLALTDPSSDVRFLALEALASDPGVKTLAEQALNDPSPHVQDKAREILGQLAPAVRTEELPAGLVPR